MGRLLLSLMGGDQTALSGGANWDGESIIAGLDGMKKSVKLPLSLLTDELESGFGDMQESFAALEPQMTALAEAFTALMDYGALSGRRFSGGRAGLQGAEHRI